MKGEEWNGERGNDALEKAMREMAKKKGAFKIDG